MFSKRLFSSMLLWSFLLIIIFYLKNLAAALFCCLITTIALLEFYDMLKRRGLPCSKPLGIIAGILLTGGTWWFSVHRPDMVNTFEILLLVCLSLGLFVRQLLDRENHSGIPMIGNTLLGVMYIPLLFNFIPKIKFLYGNGQPGKPLLIFYLVIVTKLCDTGAYVIGRMFGRHKLIPRISPKKTWEGLLGGLVLAIIASVTVFEYLRSRISAIGFEFSDALVLGIILGILGVIGDLSESLIKRETQVKDSGEVLPGIGGALDLIDSLLFTAPAMYVYLILFVRV